MVCLSTTIFALLAFAGNTIDADGIRAKEVRKFTIAINNHKAAAERAAAYKSAATEKASAEKFSSWAPRQPWFSEVLVSHSDQQADLAGGMPFTPQMPSDSIVRKGLPGARNFWQPPDFGSLNYATPLSHGANDLGIRVEIPSEAETKLGYAQSVLDSCVEAWPEDEALSWMQKNVAKALAAVRNARYDVANAQSAQSLATLNTKNEADKQVAKASKTLAAAKSQAAVAASEAKIAVLLAKRRLAHTVEGYKETVKELEEDARRGLGPWRINFDETMKRLQMAKDRKTLLEEALGKVSQANFFEFGKVPANFPKERYVDQPAADKVLSHWGGIGNTTEAVGTFFTTQDPFDRF